MPASWVLSSESLVPTTQKSYRGNSCLFMSNDQVGIGCRKKRLQLWKETIKGKQLYNHGRCAETEWLCNISDNEGTKINAKKSLCRALKQKQVLVPCCRWTGRAL